MDERTARHAKRYTPFILLVAAQAVLLAIGPTSAENDEPVATQTLAPAAGSAAAGATSFGDGAGAGTSAAAATPSGATAGSPGDTSSGGAAASSASGGSTPVSAVADAAGGLGRDPAEPGPWPWTHPWDMQGDRSKCKKDGLWQDDILWHSIPCVPIFTGNNGGATHPGVTEDEVTIVYYMNYATEADRAVYLALEQSEEQEEQHVAAWAEWFNRHYEFYGRKINVIFVRGTGDGVPAVRNDAQTIVKKYNPFGVMAYEFADTLSRELARHGVVSTFIDANQDQEMFRAMRPYAWGYFKNGDLMARNLAEYYCAKMYGKNADQAGDAPLKLQRRRVGILSTDAPHFASSLSSFVDAVTGGVCGTGSAEDKPVVFKYSSDPDASAQEQGDAAAAAFRGGNVTTIVPLVTGVGDAVAQSFSGQNYHPEWLMGEWSFDHDLYTRAFVPPDQAPQRFGPGSLWVNVASADEPFERIAREVNPNFEFRCSGCQALWEVFYQMMWGLQWAGPNLTPFTFERGMLDAPQIAGSELASPWPGWECCKRSWPSVGGIGPNDPGAYTFTQDYRHIYWDPTAISEYDGQPGTYVCAEGPECPRFRTGQWKPGEPKQPNQ
jgi:hypothetical protein